MAQIPLTWPLATRIPRALQVLRALRALRALRTLLRQLFHLHDDILRQVQDSVAARRHGSVTASTPQA